MLTFESPYYEIDGIVVFRDHAVPTLFHYLCGPPRLSRDAANRPNLMLLKYREALPAGGPVEGEAGGGFLLFGVDCGLESGTKARIQDELRSRLGPDAGAVSLVPVLYSQGTVKVLALDDDPSTEGTGSRFVRKVLGTATPSLLQDQRAIFAIALTQRGVTLLEAAYTSELSPIGVMYELEFAGLRPALNVKAHAHMSRVYESLSMEFRLGTGGGGGGGTGTGAGTGTATGAGTGTATAAGTGTATAAGTGTATAAGTGTATAAGTGTATAAGTGTATAAGTGTATGAGTGTATGAGTATATNTASNTRSGGGADVNIRLGLLIEKMKEEGAITIEIVRQSSDQSIIDMEKQALDFIKEIVLRDLFRPVMSTDPATQALGAVNQAMAAGQSQTSSGRAGSGSKVAIGFDLQYHKKDELRDIDFDFSVTAPETRTHAPNGFFSALVSDTEREKHIITVNLDDEFFKKLDLTVTTSGDLARMDLRAILAEVQYGGNVAAPAVVNSYQFDAEHLDAQQFHAFLDQGDTRWRYRVDYQFAGSAEVIGDAAHLRTDWREETGRILYVNPLQDLRLLQVFIEAGRVDWEVIDQIETQLTYTDTPRGFQTQRTWIFKPDTPAATWAVRLTPTGTDRYTVQNTWYLKGGNKIVGDVVQMREPRVFVNDPFADTLPILIDPQVDPASVLRVGVELHYVDAANQLEVHKNVELVAPYHSTTVSLPLINPSRRKYTYEVSLVKTGARSENWAPRESDDLSIVVTEGGIYCDVQLTLLGDLNAQQVDAMQVDLRAEPLEGAHAEVDSFLFTPGQPGLTTRRLLLRSDRELTFEYHVTAFKRDGTQVEQPWTAHKSRVLPLPLARILLGG